MSYLLIPLIILGVLVLLLGVVLLLGRFRGGRYLRPIVATLAKIGFMRRWFEQMSTAAIERQNPELASAMRKLKRVGPNPDPVKAQQALSQLSATERRAYLEAVQEQGAMPEPANRQQRRMQQRMQQGTAARARRQQPRGGSKKQKRAATAGKPAASRQTRRTAARAAKPSAAREMCCALHEHLLERAREPVDVVLRDHERRQALQHVEAVARDLAQDVVVAEERPDHELREERRAGGRRSAATRGCRRVGSPNSIAHIRPRPRTSLTTSKRSTSGRVRSSRQLAEPRRARDEVAGRRARAASRARRPSPCRSARTSSRARSRARACRRRPRARSARRSSAPTGT